MKSNKLSIRWKITLSNILLLTLISLLLYIGSNRSANRAIESIPMIQIAAQSSTAADDSQEVPGTAAKVQAPLQAAKKTHRIEMNFYVIGTVLLGGLFTFIISKHSLKQLEEFERHIKDTDMRKLSKKIVIKRPEPEVACLIEAYNDMTDKLEQSFALQKQFSHSVAHELRTPLTVMRTKIEVFQKKSRTSGEYQALLDLIQTYTQNLSDMVENILQYSDLSDMPAQDNIALDDMLLQVVSEIGDIYKDSCMFLEPSGISCKGNAVLLRRVFSNLIENACRYGQGEGGIQICITEQNAAVKIQISDHGIGISDCDKEHIFKPFFRVDRSRSRELGGTGLGLFFCKEIISGHGGRITVCDHKPHGTVFTVYLPA